MLTTGRRSGTNLRTLGKKICFLCCTLLENRGVGDPNLFEGDMILTPEQRAAAEAGQDMDAPASRGSIRRGLWKGGVLVYEISSNLRKLLIRQ